MFLTLFARKTHSQAQSVFLRYECATDSWYGYNCYVSEGRFIEGSDSWLIPTHEAGKNNDDVESIATRWTNRLQTSFPVIPSVLFDIFPKLIHLTLDYASLASIEQGELRRLVSFWANTGNLEVLNANIFVLCPNMRYIYIENHRIREVNREAFRGLNILEEIRLIDNQITSLDPLTFYYTPNLQWLYMGRNQLAALPTILPLTKLKTLGLDGNQIREIPPSSFDHMNDLSVLDLNNNLLTAFDGKLLQHLRNIWSLNLSGNFLINLTLTTIPEYLFIENNIFSTIRADIVPAGSRMTRFRAGFNVIHNIDPQFFQNIQFRLLSLAYNPCVDSSHVEELNINYNNDTLQGYLPLFLRCFIHQDSN